MKLIIGCPIYDRAWILPFWLNKIEKQTISLADIGFVFEAVSDDTETLDLLFSFHENHSEIPCFDINFNSEQRHISHPQSGERRWFKERYLDMAIMRNNILEKVRGYSPEFYFSLDSDILLAESNTIEKLISRTQNLGVDAVSPLCFMTPTGIQFPNTMYWVDRPGGNALRQDSYNFGEFLNVDIIMAAVLMTKPVYENVNYRWHAQGEDLGWSSECFRFGANLWLDSSVYTPHIMGRQFLDEYIHFGDGRKELTLGAVK